MSQVEQSEDPITRMDRFMELRGFAANTVAVYRRSARRFLRVVGKSPEEITERDIEEYLLGLRSQGSSPTTRNVNLVAIRCLLGAIKRRTVGAEIPFAKVKRQVPDILNGAEVTRPFGAVTSPKYKAIFMLAYGAGLRVSEVGALQVGDIDSGRMLIRVPESKYPTAVRDDGRSRARRLEGLPASRAPLRPRALPWISVRAPRDQVDPRRHSQGLAQGGPAGGDHQAHLAT